MPSTALLLLVDRISSSNAKKKKNSWSLSRVHLHFSTTGVNRRSPNRSASSVCYKKCQLNNPHNPRNDYTTPYRSQELIRLLTRLSEYIAFKFLYGGELRIGFSMKLKH